MKIVKNVWKIGQNIPINIQDAVVLFMLSNLGAFIFEFTLDAVIIKSAVVFAPIRYLKHLLLKNEVYNGI